MHGDLEKTRKWGHYKVNGDMLGTWKESAATYTRIILDAAAVRVWRKLPGVVRSRRVATEGPQRFYEAHGTKHSAGRTFIGSLTWTVVLGVVAEEWLSSRWRCTDPSWR